MKVTRLSCKQVEGWAMINTFDEGMDPGFSYEQISVSAHLRHRTGPTNSTYSLVLSSTPPHLTLWLQSYTGTQFLVASPVVVYGTYF